MDIVLFLRAYTLKRRIIRQGDEEEGIADEKAEKDDDVKTIEGVQLPKKVEKEAEIEEIV